MTEYGPNKNATTIIPEHKYARHSAGSNTDKKADKILFVVVLLMMPFNIVFHLQYPTDNDLIRKGDYYAIKNINKTKDTTAARQG